MNCQGSVELVVVPLAVGGKGAICCSGSGVMLDGRRRFQPLTVQVPCRKLGTLDQSLLLSCPYMPCSLSSSFYE